MTWEITLQEQPGGHISAAHSLYNTSYNLTTKEDTEVLKLLKNLADGTDTGVLPPVVRWVSPQRRYAILERPPMMMDINYYGVRAMAIKNAKQLQEHTIPLPWTVYCVGFDAYMRPTETHLFATKGSIQNGDQELFVLPLTNVYPNGRFCLPNLPEAAQALDAPWSMGEGLNAAFGQVWMSNFNTDITDTVVNAFRNKRPGILFPENDKDNYLRVSPAKLLKRWSELTLEQVANIEDWPYQNGNNPYRVRQLMADAMNWENTAYTSNVLYNTLRTMMS